MFYAVPAHCARVFTYLLFLLTDLHVQVRCIPPVARHGMAPSEHAGPSAHAGPSEPFEDDLVQLAASSPSVGARTAHCVDGTVPRLAGLPTPASFRELVAP